MKKVTLQTPKINRSQLQQRTLSKLPIRMMLGVIVIKLMMKKLVENGSLKTISTPILVEQTLST